MEPFFDEAEAQKAVDWFQKICVHTKSDYAKRPFILTDWQRNEIIRPLFGTLVFDEVLGRNRRMFTLAWIELARKNGKSEIAAGIALKLLMADGEEEAEIYGVAKDKRQAQVVYQVAKRMVQLSPILSKKLKSKEIEIIDSIKRIIYVPTGSFYQVISADGDTALGTNPHGVIFDEVITQRDRELWDALKTGMGTRAQPLMVALTTAGNNTNSMAAEEHAHSVNVQADHSIDPTRFVYLRNTPEDADWRDEKNWSFANPGLDDFLRRDILRAEAKEAERSPVKQNVFRQFRLNQWVRQTIRWLDIAIWDENKDDKLESLDGRECFGGLDLASTSDFTAFVLLFPPLEEDEAWHLKCRFWLPSAAVEVRAKMRDQLELWARKGWLTVTPGEITDYDKVYKDIDEDAARYRIKSIGYDRWNSSELVRKLRDGGLKLEGIAQTTTNLNGASKELERLLGKRQLDHGGDPVLRWMADNVLAFVDSSGNIKPDRKNSGDKIDGIMATVMAIYQSIAKAETKREIAFIA